MSLYSWGIFGDEAVTVVSSAKLKNIKSWWNFVYR